MKKWPINIRIVLLKSKPKSKLVRKIYAEIDICITVNINSLFTNLILRMALIQYLISSVIMSVYGGFPTRELETTYNMTVMKVLHLMANHVN